MAKNATEEPEGVNSKPQTKIRYPIGIPFIICGKFFERFAFLGVQTVLIIYLTGELSYSLADSTVIYHANLSLQFMAAILGAIISDSYMGKYRLIAVMSMFFLCGTTIIFIGSIPSIGLARGWTLCALLMVSFGAGCMKPVILAFGGDQFKMPEQAAQMTSFFSLFFITLKAGSLASSTIAPILRNDVKCYGMDYCFPMIFGVCTAFSVICIGFFFAGTKWYRIVPSKGNVLAKVCKCIWYARAKKRKIGDVPSNTHWLDLAEAKFGKELVNNSKVLINLLVLYIPVPVYWSLTEQIGSSFTIQATQMDGRLPFYTIKPDQFQVVHSLLLICLIPLFNVYVYPFLSRLGIKQPLQKMCIGGLLTTFSFVLAGLLQLRFSSDNLVEPKAGICQLRVYNPMPYDFVMRSAQNDQQLFIVPSMQAIQKNVNAMDVGRRVTFEPMIRNCSGGNTSIVIWPGRTVNYLLLNNTLRRVTELSKRGITDMHFLKILTPHFNQSIRIRNTISNQTLFEGPITEEHIAVPPSDYQITLNSFLIVHKTISPSGVSTLLLAYDPQRENAINHTWIENRPPNTVHMLWLLPQYIVLAMGDAIFSVTGLSFTYAEAPASMKTVMQACWLMLLSFGNAINMIVVGAHIFESQTLQFFAFAALLFVDMMVFAWLAKRYRPNKHIVDVDDCEEKNAMIKK